MKGSRGSLGIIPLAMQHVFAHVRSSRDHEFLLRMSYIEIYNEHVKDLLNPGANADLPIHESRTRGVHVQSVEKIVRNEGEVLALLEAGEAARHYGRTDMNDFSSRSHTILRLLIESNPISEDAAREADREVASFCSPNSQQTTSMMARGKDAKKAKAPRVKVSLLNFVDRQCSTRGAAESVR